MMYLNVQSNCDDVWRKIGVVKEKRIINASHRKKFKYTNAEEIKKPHRESKKSIIIFDLLKITAASLTPHALQPMDMQALERGENSILEFVLYI